VPRNKYPWILKWGQLTGLRQYEVVELIARAHAEAAPADAVYRDRKGHWRTTADIKDLYTRRGLGLITTPVPSVVVESSDAQS
jgi:hypothetical protein